MASASVRESRYLPRLLVLGYDMAAKSFTPINAVYNAALYAIDQVGSLYSNPVPREDERAWVANVNPRLKEAVLYDVGFRGNPALIRVLTGTEHHPAFNSIKDLHDFFAVLFPPSIHQLPRNWKKVVGKVPHTIFLKKMKEEVKRLMHLKQGVWFFQQMIIRLYEQHPELKRGNLHGPSPFSIEEILEVLLETHPVFAKAWELANQSESITLEESPKEEFMLDGKTVFTKESGAAYLEDEHKIKIQQESSVTEKIRSLLFETMNALQRRSFQSVDRASEAGQVGREEYALQTEWIERNSFNWSEYMVAIMTSNQYKRMPFSTYWKESNVRHVQADHVVSHTDSYRRQWDALYSAKYLAEHPDFLPRRLRELAAPEQEEKKRD